MRVEVEGGVAGWKGVKLDKNPKIPLSGFTQKRLEGWGWGDREGCGGGVGTVLLGYDRQLAPMLPTCICKIAYV